MEIKRNIIKKLEEWKDSEERRPLILHGARQIGKTWAIMKFGELHFKYTAYFNFDSNTDLCVEFQRTKDANRLIQILGLYCDVPIIAKETLIVFDEIQECPEALNSLKYFCEETPSFHIVAAGSLLGVALHKGTGFPVGKVDFLKMYPVSFDEYFRAYNEKFGEIIDTCRDKKDFLSMPEILKTTLDEGYRHYRVCGGMPKVAVASLERKGNDKITIEQNELLSSFFRDFSKHAPLNDFPRIALIWDSLPSQLSKENRKFLYKVVKPGARAREFEAALNWLREAGLIYQIFCSTKPGLPLSAYDDVSAFKIYMLDCGLLRALANMPAELYVVSKPEFSEFKGALMENLVLQQLLASSWPMPRYWVSNGSAEVDFILQDGLDIIPFEIKSGNNIASKSLAVYIKKYHPGKSVIISENELSIKSGETIVFKIPAYLLPWGLRLLQED